MTRGRFGRLGRVAVLLGLVLLAILALEQLLTRFLPLEDIVQEFARELGRPVEVDSMRLQLLPFPHAHFEGLRVEPDGTIDAADVELRVRPFLHGGVEGARARLRGVRITLRRGVDGSLAFGGREEGSSPGKETASDPGPAALPALPRVELRDVALTFEDEAAVGGARTTRAFLTHAAIRTRRRADAATLEARGHLGSLPGPDSFAVRFDLMAAPPGGRRAWTLEVRTTGIDPKPIVPHLPPKWGFRAARGSLDALVAVARDEEDVETGRLELEFAPGSVDYAGVALEGRIVFRSALRDQQGLHLSGARAEADRIVLGPLDARQLRARLRYARGRLVFEELDFETWGGRVRGELRIEPFEDPVAFASDFHATGLELHQLPGGSPGAEPMPQEDETFVDASGSFHGRWVGGSDWMARIEGEGSVTMRGGSLPAGRVLASAFRKLLATGGETRSGARTSLEALRATLSFEEGRAHTTDLSLDTDDYHVDARGSVGPLGDLELEGEIHFATSVLQWFSLGTLRERRSGSYPGVPFELRGRLGDPDLELRFTEGTRTTVVLLPRAVGELTDKTTAPLGLGRRAVEGALDLFRSGSDPEDAPPAAPPADGPPGSG